MTRMQNNSAVACLALPLLFVAPHARAQFLDRLTSPEKAALNQIGGMSVDGALNKLNDQVNQMAKAVSDHETLGFDNAIITLHSEIQAVQEAFDSEDTKVVGQINDTRLSALLDLYNETQLVNNDIKSDTKSGEIDGLVLLNHVNFLGKSTLFMVGAISPVNLAYQDSGDYSVTITGIGLGKDEDVDYHTHVSLTSPSGAALANSVTYVPDGVTMTIPRAALQSAFDGSDISRINVVVSSTVQPRRTLSNWFPKPKVVSFPYQMIILPRKAIHVQIEQSRNVPGDDGIDVPLGTSSVTTQDRDGQSAAPFVGSPSVFHPDPGYVLSKALQVSCKAVDVKKQGGCNYVTEGPEIKDAILATRGQTIEISGQNNGHAVNMVYEVYERKIVYTKKDLGNLDYYFSPGQQQIVAVNSDADSVLMTVIPVVGDHEATTLLPAGGQATDLVTCTVSGPSGGQTQYRCRAKGIEAF